MLTLNTDASSSTQLIFFKKLTRLAREEKTVDCVKDGN